VTRLSEYAKTPEAAETLRVPQNTLRKCAARGDIPMRRNPANLRDELDLLDDDDIEGVDELADEYEEDAEVDAEDEIDPEKLKDELADLRRYAELAARIGHNAKGDKLLPALQIAFAKAEELGAARKAVIFTESRETQMYLYDLLTANGHEGQAVTINGTNKQPHHAAIYERWLAKHEGTDAPSLATLCEAEVSARLGEIDTRNARFFDEQVLKLGHWSEDLKLSLEHEIKELDKQIRELRRTAALAQSLQDKLTHQKQLRDLERRRNSKRRELFDAQDAIDQQREDLIGKIEKQLKHRSGIQTLFTIRWRVV